MKPLRIKILGLGHAGKNQREALYDLPELYQIVDDNKYDIVSICTPNHLHYEQCASAISQSVNLKKHCAVIVEKPLCGSLSQCDLLISLSNETKRQIYPVFQYRYAGHEQPIPNQIITSWCRGEDYYRDWRGDWETALGGALVSHGIHAIDLMLSQNLRLPKIVSAGMDTYLGVEKFADVMMGDPGRMQRISTMLHPAVYQDNPNNFQLGNSHLGYIEFFKRVHEKETAGVMSPILLERARNVLEIITAAYWSAYSGEPAILPITPDHPFYSGWSEHFMQRSIT